MDVIQSFLRSDKPIQYIRYLENEVDPTCPEFKEYAKVLIETFDPVLYDKLHEGHATEMGHFFLKTANPELSLVFIKRVLSAEKWCLDQDGQMTHVNRKFIELFAELIKSIPWEDIKETLDFTLDHLDFSLIPGWLEVYKHTQISYIAHKVIESSLLNPDRNPGQKCVSLSTMDSELYGYRRVWTQLIYVVFGSKHLSECWLEKLSECRNITNDIDLMSLLFTRERLPDENKTLRSRIWNYFIECIKYIKDLGRVDHHGSRYNSVGRKHGYSVLIKDQIRPFMKDFNEFKEDFSVLFKYLLSSDNSVIVSRILIAFSKDCFSKPQSETEGFKIIFNMYMDHLWSVKLNDSHVEELANIAQALVRNKEYNPTSPHNKPILARFHKLLKTLEKPSLLYKLAFQLFRFSEDEDLDDLDFTDSIGHILQLLVQSFANGSIIEMKGLASFIVFLLNENKFQSILTEMLSHKRIIPHLKECSKDLAYLLLEKPQKTENFKKVLSIILVGVTGWFKKKECVVYGGPLSTSNLIHHLMKLLSSDHYFHDSQILLLDQFRVEGHDNLLDCRRAVSLKGLIRQFKDNINVLRVRVLNLRSLKESGVPKLSWKQPRAHLPEEPEIEEFLRSEEITFVYPAFQNKEEAREWIKNYAGVRNTYSFTAVARPFANDGSYEVVLQKGRDIFEKSKKKFFDLMDELEGLETRLKASHVTSAHSVNG